MKILLESGCTKSAYKNTKRIVSRYLPRINQKSWYGQLTSKAVENMREELLSKARKNTSIVCYVIRNEELMILWRIGNHSVFSKEGLYMDNEYSGKSLIYPDWLKIADLYARLAGLIHDIGKTGDHFQGKLRDSKKTELDVIRHELISAVFLITVLTMYKEEIRSNKDFKLSGTFSYSVWGTNWENVWKEVWGNINKLQKSRKNMERFIFDSKSNPSVLEKVLVGIIITHHKLLLDFGKNPLSSHFYNENANGYRPFIDIEESKSVVGHIDDNKPNPVMKKIAQYLDSLLSMEESVGKQKDFLRFISTYSRAAMIAADHYISSQSYCDSVLNEAQDIDWNNTYAANTHLCSDSEERRLNQPLNWHLLNVSESASKMARMFYNLHMGTGLPSIIVPDGYSLVNKNSPERFAWQDRGIKSIMSLREEYPEQPLLIFLNAGTGSGKTQAGIKAGLAASRGEPRLTSIFNLRTLTSQTGAEYRNIGFEPDIIIGDKVSLKIGVTEAAKAKQDHNNESLDVATEYGVELDNDTIDVQCKSYFLPEETKQITQGSKNAKAIIASPLLVSTADYIAYAGDPNAQRRHVLALLRCSNSDLIIDEIDSYDTNAILAICRVIEIAASFGRNIIVSSATLSPVIADAVFKSFQDGQKMYYSIIGRTGKGKKENGSDVAYAVINNYINPIVECSEEMDHSYCNDIRKVLKEQAEHKHCRKMKPLYVYGCTIKDIAENIFSECVALHETNSSHIDNNEANGKASIGAIRVLRSKRGFALSALLCEQADKYMQENNDKVIKVVYYHANMQQGARVYVEAMLEQILHREINRDECPKNLYQHIREGDKHKDHIFIIVATPVIDVGRDFDLDWGICEPTSVRAIVQFAGRINRHRMIHVEKPNLSIMDYPLTMLNGEIRGQEDIKVLPSTHKLSFREERSDNVFDFYEASAGPDSSHPESITKELFIDIVQANDGVVDARLCIPEITEDSYKFDVLLQECDNNGQYEILFSKLKNKYPANAFSIPLAAKSFVGKTFCRNIYNDYPLRKRHSTMCIHIQDSKAYEIDRNGDYIDISDYFVPLMSQTNKSYDSSWLGFNEKSLDWLKKRYRLSETEVNQMEIVNITVYNKDVPMIFYHPDFGVYIQR